MGTLSSVVKNSASSSGSSSIDNGAEIEKLKKEQKNQDTKSEERGETDSSEPSLLDQMKNIPVAGRPSDTPRRLHFMVDKHHTLPPQHQPQHLATLVMRQPQQ